MIDKTAGAHKYGWRVWENKLTGPGLSAAPLRLSITDLTGALRKKRHTRVTHTAHTCVSVHAHMSLKCALETIREPYNSHLLHYQQTEFTLSDMYQELSVIESCQPLHKIQCRGKNVRKSQFYTCRIYFTWRQGGFFLNFILVFRGSRGRVFLKEATSETKAWWMLRPLWAGSLFLHVFISF